MNNDQPTPVSSNPADQGTVPTGTNPPIPQNPLNSSGSGIPFSTENIESPPPPIISTSQNPVSSMPEINGGNASVSPINLPPVVAISGKKGSGGGPKNKKRVIATILGLLVLVGGAGAGVILVQQQQDIREQAATGSCSGCGEAPAQLPGYNTPPTYMSFTVAGQVIVYYAPIDSPDQRTLRINYKGQISEVHITSANSRQRIETGIMVNHGDTIMLTDVIESNQQAACAPNNSTPSKALGWINMNADKTCGTTLPGPPTGGLCPSFTPKDAGAHESWAESYKDTIVSKQCWADWMEWPGDYDFNDFFLAFAVQPTINPTPTPTPKPTPTATPRLVPTPSPTPPLDSPSSCMCHDIKAYTVTGDVKVWSNWKELSSTQLAALKASDEAYFTVRGSYTGTGEINNARFTINQGTPVTGIRHTAVTGMGAAERLYYTKYVIPANTTSFSIKAEIYHTSLGWF